MPSNGNPRADDGGTPAKHAVRRRTLLGSLGAAGTALIAGCETGGDGGDGGGGGDGGDGGGDGGDGGDGGGGGGGGQQYLITDIEDNPPSLDPHAVEPTDFNANGVWPMNAYETLVFYESGGPELMPVLATEIPTIDNGLITNDGLTYEFPLREGVQFHTGGEMTSEDVRYSIERNQTLGLSPGSSAVQEQIVEIETPDDYTVRLTTDQLRPSFLNGTVASRDMVIMSQEAVENNGGVEEGERNRYVAQNTLGTGPYMLGDWQRGSSLRYDYFEDYWDPDSVGPDGVYQRIHTEVASAVAQIESGGAHTTAAEAGDLDAFEGSGAEVTEFASLEQLFLFFNYEIPYDRDNMPDDDTVPSSFFQDPSVRRAFGYAIDYEDYYDRVWNGQGTRSNQPCHLNGMAYFDEDAPNFSHDPDMAEQMLRDAGYWEEGFTFTIMSETFAEAEATVLYLKDVIESLNDRITINTLTMPEAQYVERRNQDPWSFTMDAGGFPSFGPDPAPYYNNLLEGPPAEGGRHREYIDDRFYELAEEASTTLDTDRRQEIYSELQALAIEDPPAISLLAEGLVKIHLPCVEPEINPSTSKDVHKRWDVSACDPINF